MTQHGVVPQAGAEEFNLGRINFIVGQQWGQRTQQGAAFRDQNRIEIHFAQGFQMFDVFHQVMGEIIIVTQGFQEIHFIQILPAPPIVISQGLDRIKQFVGHGFVGLDGGHVPMQAQQGFAENFQHPFAVSGFGDQGGETVVPLFRGICQDSLDLLGRAEVEQVGTVTGHGMVGGKGDDLDPGFLRQRLDGPYIVSKQGAEDDIRSCREDLSHGGFGTGDGTPGIGGEQDQPFVPGIEQGHVGGVEQGLADFRIRTAERQQKSDTDL